MVSRASLAGRHWGLIILTGSTLLLGGCKDYAFLNLQGTAMQPPETRRFQADLADEYQALAEFARGEEQNPQMADLFYGKSRGVASGQDVEPEPLDKYKIPAFAREDLNDARRQLTDALARVNTPENSRMLAMAQVKFDCWLAYQPYQKKKDGYIGCRESFRQAMAYVDFSKVAKKPLATKRGAAPEPQTIHFINDTMTLDQGAHQAIAALADNALENEGTIVRLVGYSKKAVTIEDTSDNAVRRIIAVRNALYQNGVDPDSVEIEFVKGGDPQDVDIELLSPSA